MTWSTTLPVIHMNIHLEMSEGEYKRHRQDGIGGRVSADEIRQFTCNAPSDMETAMLEQGLGGLSWITFLLMRFIFGEFFPFLCTEPIETGTYSPVNDI